MCNSAGDPFAFRFGLFRMIDINVNHGYLTDPRPIPHPQLQELACDATGLLYQLPAEVATKVWRNWLCGFSRGQNSNEYLWFDALFELAWQRQPGGPLHAIRLAWVGRASVGLIGSGLFPRLLEHPNWPLLDKLPHEGGYPMAYYSILSDVARASVTAIDEIIELGKTVDGKTNESPLRVEGSPALDTTVRKEVFISYCHKDVKFLNELLTHLKPLERAGLVAKWSDQQIAPGSKWFAEIQAALGRAKVAVMMVTPSFLASDFIDEHELGPLLKEAEKSGVRILWIPVRACNYKQTPLEKYQAVISPDKPLAPMGAARDAAWVKVCEEIKKAVVDP
jgi:hypothetical protein